MEKVKFGYSGKINYEKAPEFPIVYYMKILDEDENIIININFKNISSSFIPGQNNNYTDVFDLSCYIVDESMIISMMREEKINPPLDKIIKGYYDQSITTAKLYISSSQIKSEDLDSKYIIVSLNKNDKSDSLFYSFGVDVNIMPFSNMLYNSPYNEYINANLLLEDNESKCNYHKLIAGKQEDKYMYIEFSKISEDIIFNIKDSENNVLSFNDTLKEKFGKYTRVVYLNNSQNVILEVCKNNSNNSDFSSNYVFKVKSNEKNNFTEHVLLSDEIKYNHNIKNEELKLSIPKILNINQSNAENARYTVRLFYKDIFKKNEKANSIAFIPYYPYSTYIYDVSVDENSINNLEITLKEFPSSEPFIVSVIAVTKTNEEIFAYKQINIEVEEIIKEKENNTFLWVIAILLIIIVIVLIALFVYFFIKMRKQQLDLMQQVQNISMKLPREIEEDQGMNDNPLLGAK